MRGTGRKQLKHSELLNPNEAYGTVKLESLNNGTNQTNSGVSVTNYDGLGDKTNKTIYKKPDSDDNTKYIYTNGN